MRQTVKNRTATSSHQLVEHTERPERTPDEAKQSGGVLFNKKLFKTQLFSAAAETIILSSGMGGAHAETPAPAR